MRLELDIRSEEALWTMSRATQLFVYEIEVSRHILDCAVGRTVKASFGKCTRTSTVAGGSRVLGLITTSSGDIATSVPIVGL